MLMLIDKYLINILIASTSENFTVSLGHHYKWVSVKNIYNQGKYAKVIGLNADMFVLSHVFQSRLL